MKITQMLPFERNRYYYGKMLTSQDFRAEQQYMNSKRMFLNQMVFGSGVLCGLSVYKLDDFSVLVESGTAVDSLGREIILDKSVVKKLTTLEGYREDGDSLCLCLSYQEEETFPVYAVNRKEEQAEYENNRIQERYRLFLADTHSTGHNFSLDSEFFVEAELSRDTDYVARIRMPANACRGRKFRIVLEVVKLSDRKKELNLSYMLQMPCFCRAGHERSMEIEETVKIDKKGGQRSFHYWIKAENTELKETSILIKPKQGTVQELKVFLTNEEPEELIRCSLGRPSLEIREAGKEDTCIPLADIFLKHTKTACMIDYIEEKNVKHYVDLPSEVKIRQDYLSYYGGSEGSLYPGKMAEETAEEDACQEEAKAKEPNGEEGKENPPIVQEEEHRMMPAETGEVQALSQMPGEEGDRQVKGGILEIPLEQRMKKGSICFSEEISHGLGPGSVYVAVGIDEPEEGAHAKRKIQSTIYGDMELFEGQNPSQTSVRTAVKVWEEKGSFQVAAKLAREQNTVLLSLHWIAFRIPGTRTGTGLKENNSAQIRPKTVTIHLKCREKHFFAVQFHNMPPCRLRYELTEEGSGRIEEDGTYTAPRKAGVYEVKISCEEYPEICTYAYAVVSGK